MQTEENEMVTQVKICILQPYMAKEARQISEHMEDTA